MTETQSGRRRPVPLFGSTPVHRPGAERRRRARGEDRAEITVVLAPGSPPAEHPLAEKIRRQDRLGAAAPGFRRDELESLLAPPEAAVEAVLAFARRHGLEVIETSKLRHDVVLAGSIADLESAFAITLHDFEHEQGSYRAHDEPLRVPGSWEGRVEGVLGLDSLAHHRPHAAAAGENTAAALQPERLAEYYEFPEPGEMGTTRIALLEFGGGYYADDLGAYLAERGLAVPSVTVIPITDGTGAAGSNAPLDRDTLRTLIDAWNAGASYTDLVATFGNTLNAFSSTLEVTMDLELVAALAPGAPIDLYFAPGTADGWRRSLYAALGEPLPGSLPAGLERDESTVPAVISASWGMAERGWGEMKLGSLHRALDAARRRGVTVCCSSGDFGSRDSSRPGGGRNVNFPASSPAVLACGGASARLAAGRIEGEAAWNEEVHGVELATGGGMSGYFARPDYQHRLATPDASGTWIGETAPGASAAGFAGRWLPDVAAAAAYSPGVAVRLAGKRFAGGGTSAATPIWAALVARLSAALGRSLGSLHPILYRLGSGTELRDIEDGDNDLSGDGDSAHYRAAGGWDACTGLGSPRGRALLAALRQPAAEPPPEAPAGGRDDGGSRAVR